MTDNSVKLLLLVLASCTGSEDIAGDAAPRGEVDAQAGTDDGGDDRVPCPASAAYGDLGVVGDVAYIAIDGDDPALKYYYLEVPGIEAGPPPDDLLIELWEGEGVFSAGTITTGTVELTGPEANYDDCGVCVIIEGDVVEGESALDYIATAGRMTLTSVEGRLTGALEDVTLTGFAYDADDNFVLRADCTTRIDGASFDVELRPEP